MQSTTSFSATSSNDALSFDRRLVTMLTPCDGSILTQGSGYSTSSISRDPTVVPLPHQARQYTSCSPHACAQPSQGASCTGSVHTLRPPWI